MKKIKLFSTFLLLCMFLFTDIVSAAEEIDVPDTLSTNSTLLIAIAMFDIALGIGVITYVKKNRIKE